MNPCFRGLALSAILTLPPFAVSAAYAAEPTEPVRIDVAALSQSQAQGFERFLVTYRKGAAMPQSAASMTSEINGAARRSQMRAGAVAPQARQVRRLSGSSTQAIRMSRPLNRSEAESLMRSIATNPDVEYVGPDIVHQPTAAPNDPMFPTYQWHYVNPVGGINAQTAWDNAATGAGVVVAVLDTGVTQHSDLAANLLPGYDFIVDHEISGRETDGRTAGGADLGDWTVANQCGAGSQASNSTWHGTHVTGTIAEVSNNGIGMAGVAPLAKVVPVRVLGHCGGLTSDIIDGITWASGGAVDGVPVNPNPAEVINMSLSGGSDTCPVPYQAAIDAAVARGTTIVVAAGNNAADASARVPANCKNVITVASTGITGKRASYSNYGTRVDISAPGGGVNDGANQTQGYVWSTWNSGTTTPQGESYVGMVGTSMASPHVAGIVALIQQTALSTRSKVMTPAEVAGLLKQTARAFPVFPDRPLGVGIVDAGAAVVAAKTGGTPLANGVVKAGLTANAGESFVYVFPVAAGTSRLTITSYGGSGQVSLLTKRDGEPSATDFEASSQRPGNNQLIMLNNPAAGTYYLKVVAASGVSGLSLKAVAQ